MTLAEASSTLLILVLQSSPQAALLDWIMQNQPEDLALMEVEDDGILQIRELPRHWGQWLWSKDKEGIRLLGNVQRNTAPTEWVYLGLKKKGIQ